jgi:hypothetical protein
MIFAQISLRVRGIHVATASRSTNGAMAKRMDQPFAIQDRRSVSRYLRMQFSAVASFAWPRMNGR